MKIKQYDTVKLKDGRVGCVVEKWSETDFEVDVGSGPADWETITAKLDDIAEVVTPQKA
ncbi:MAG: hypothetical protein ACK5JF_02760 [Oscillospiraceae bacterium]